ncbi:hypothetical protein [Hyphomicrobium sp. DY-1]|uniref:hypothetical protein n=1 Tax=Hyphomicrobium sp. DY-1 TaxID=3075650 RepID=UPI0039C17778
MANTSDSPLRFRVFLNKSKEPGDKRPLLTGKLLPPGTTVERNVSLWPHYTGKENGNLPGVLTGRLGTGLSADDQMALYANAAPQQDYTIEMAMKDNREPMKIKPNDVVLFLNPNREKNPKQPNYFGYANPGNGEPLLSIGSWMGTDKQNDLMMTGDVQKWEPRMEKDMEAQAPATERPERTGHARVPDDDHEEEEERAM